MFVSYITERMINFYDLTMVKIKENVIAKHYITFLADLHIFTSKSEKLSRNYMYIQNKILVFT